jgi:hypothetical protein
LTEWKNRCRITTHNPPIPLEKTEFVTYSLPIPALCLKPRYPVEICIGREDGCFIDYKEGRGRRRGCRLHLLMVALQFFQGTTMMKRNFCKD